MPGDEVHSITDYHLVPREEVHVLDFNINGLFTLATATQIVMGAYFDWKPTKDITISICNPLLQN